MARVFETVNHRDVGVIERSKHSVFSGATKTSGDNES